MLQNFDTLYFFVFVQGVESEQCASFSTAMDAGHPIYTKSGPTLADGRYKSQTGIFVLYSK